MEKKEATNFVAGLAALVGGVWLAAELVKLFAKKETYYSCPVCGYDIKYGVVECPNCHTSLEWPNLNNEQPQ
jgi:hypothetical protein